ncbi:MAG: type IV pilin-like G/H family protein [Cyanobacteriota bacterium]
MRSTKKYPESVYLKIFNMNICCRAKWLQYLSNKNVSWSNVLIALLVVIIIVGVLVAMEKRSSSMKCGGNRYEGKMYVGSMNKAQEANYLENGNFVASLPELGIVFSSKTKDYEYSIRATKTAVFNYAIAQKTASKTLKNYVGAVFIVPASNAGKKAAKNHKEMLSILCETDTPTNQLPAEPTYQKGVLTCGSNTQVHGSVRSWEVEQRREAESYTRAMNERHQAYYLENGNFVASMPLGLPNKTINYEYSVRTTKTAVFNYAIAQKTAFSPLKSYVGAVFIVPASNVGKKAAKNHKEMLSILCETDTPTSQIPAEPTYQKGVLACGSNTQVPASVRNEEMEQRREAKRYTREMNERQQAYYLENGNFVASMPKLSLTTGIPTKTINYEYSVRTTKTAVFNYAIAQKTAFSPLNSYVGAVFIVPTSKVGKKAAKNNKEALAIVCETDTPTSQIPAEPTYQKGILACGSNTHSIPYSIP